MRYKFAPAQGRGRGEFGDSSILDQWGKEMKIYYRGYAINQEHPESRCTVQGTWPRREMLAFAADPQGAMRWVDREILRRKVEEAGWLRPWALSG